VEAVVVGGTVGETAVVDVMTGGVVVAGSRLEV
jgi:hypothetical protein